jgi:hypothetical protein
MLLDPGPGDDPVTDRGVRIAEEDQRVLEQNPEKHPATLTGIGAISDPKRFRRERGGMRC